MEFVDTTTINIIIVALLICLFFFIRFILKIVKKVAFKIISISSLIATYGYFLLSVY